MDIQLGSLQLRAVAEYQRLIAAQTEANKSGDPDRIRDAADEFTLFMRYSGQGRLQDYFAAQQAQEGTRT
jgi:hypothetical protein